MDYWQRLYGLCCSTHGYSQRILRAGTVIDRDRWIHALQRGLPPVASQSPVSPAEACCRRRNTPSSPSTKTPREDDDHEAHHEEGFLHPSASGGGGNKTTVSDALFGEEEEDSRHGSPAHRFRKKASREESRERAEIVDPARLGRRGGGGGGGVGGGRGHTKRGGGHARAAALEEEELRRTAPLVGVGRRNPRRRRTPRRRIRRTFRGGCVPRRRGRHRGSSRAAGGRGVRDRERERGHAVPDAEGERRRGALVPVPPSGSVPVVDWLATSKRDGRDAKTLAAGRPPALGAAQGVQLGAQAKRRRGDGAGNSAAFINALGIANLFGVGGTGANSANGSGAANAAAGGSSSLEEDRRDGGKSVSFREETNGLEFRGGVRADAGEA